MSDRINLEKLALYKPMFFEDLSARSTGELIDIYRSAERRVQRLEERVKTNEKKLKELTEQEPHVARVQELYRMAVENEKKRNEDVKKTEQLLHSFKAHVRTENSKTNTSDEVKQIRKEIKEAFDGVHLEERTANELAMDCSQREHDIKVSETEFKEKKERAEEYLKNVYKVIEDFRQEVPNVRKKSLQSLIEKEDRMVQAELEYQRLNSRVLLLQQLIISLQAETANITNHKGKGVLAKELEKVDAAIKAMPVYEPFFGGDLKEECGMVLDEIVEMENEIYDTNDVISAAEKTHDKMTYELQLALWKNEDLAEINKNVQALSDDLDTKLEYLSIQEQDAHEQIEDLEESERNLKVVISRLQMQLNRLEKSHDSEKPPEKLDEFMKKMAQVMSDLQQKIDDMEKNVES